METINKIELQDELIFPDDKILKGVLEDSYGTYTKLLHLFEDNELISEWRYYKDGKAWLCKVQKNKKTIVWMSAWKGYMQAGIYIPLRLIDEVYNLPLQKNTINKIKKTKNVGKSKPCIFEVRNESIIKDLNTVMQFKIIVK